MQCICIYICIGAIGLVDESTRGGAVASARKQRSPWRGACKYKTYPTSENHEFSHEK